MSIEHGSSKEFLDLGKNGMLENGLQRAYKGRVQVGAPDLAFRDNMRSCFYHVSPMHMEPEGLKSSHQTIVEGLTCRFWVGVMLKRPSAPFTMQ